ncbi:MAG: Fibronectin type III domain protein [Candidatus Woesebacteria bacterium GW2011_GWA1_37_7]|uniref:Fibronectin type III domain protein n=1 Tax=Candidatus Woesebacteria bacterium GW2011_GWA1_37_7 TaxID=1618545 RepID=A0A0G0KAE7_9BACT|nr:MAG: Fibronectin type III domain protein [Candidatus Woesebacteria bacterium GW2011_GWA1_37_7]
MPKKLLFALSLFSFLVLIFSGFVKNVGATVSACTATVSPTSVTTYSSNSFTISVQNTDSVSYSWIKITVPSSRFTITGGSIPGAWNWSSGETEVTMINSTLSAGSTQSVNLTVEVRGGDAAASANWTIQVSDDSGGASPFTCTGTLGTEITSGGTDTYAPVISSLTVSEVAQTSVKITWTTDESSNSVVQYGTTTAYGSTKTDTSLVTSHSVTVDSLSSNTSYHFKVQSTDSSSNTAESDDNTFVTSQAATSTTVTTTTTVTKTVEKLVDDTEKPGISFTTKFDKPFSATPEISGKVTDNQGVADVAYSIDGGANYLPVDELTNPRTKTANFQFSIFNLLDGNYKIRVRATDLTGNSAISEEKILIFDRLPPRTGAVVYSLGSQILEPDESGVFTTISGLDQKITLSAVGGPTEISLISQMSHIGPIKEKTLASESQVFSLTKNPDTGLWSGTVSFSDPGNYTLSAKSVDGAGNEILFELGNVQVLNKGRVVVPSASKEAPDRREINVYYFESTTNQFVLWDAAAYGQENPIKVDLNANYSLILPAGKYFFEIRDARYGIRKNTEIFTIDRTTPINTDFNLAEQKSINLGPWSFSLPEIFQEPLKIDISHMGLIRPIESQVHGKEIPYFSLEANEFTFDSFYFRGKPTVFTFVNTWHPSASEQIEILGALSRDTKFNYVVVIPQESLSKIEIYKKLGGYEVLMLADPDSTFFGELDLSNLPAHVFTDNKGVVKKIKIGTLNTEEVIGNLLM